MQTNNSDYPQFQDSKDQTQKKTLSQQIYDALKEDIHHFRLVPGDRFSESGTSQRLGVSRTPLREALQRLQSEDFIDVDQKSGWYVKPIDFDYLGELYEFRVLLEMESVARLCKMEAAHPVLDQLGRFWLVPDEERLENGQIVSQHDEIFHSTLVEASGNREMLKIHKHITERIRIVRQLDFTKSKRITATYREHAEILRAIISKDVSTAQHVLRMHIQESADEVKGITLHALMTARSKLIK